MKQQNCKLRWAMLIACVLFLTVRDAQAYLDPGSSSYFFQILIAGLTAIIYFFSSIKRRVLRLFGKKETPVDTSASKPPAPAPAPESENAPLAR